MGTSGAFGMGSNVNMPHEIKPRFDNPFSPGHNMFKSSGTCMLQPTWVYRFVGWVKIYYIHVHVPVYLSLSLSLSHSKLILCSHDQRDQNPST